MNLLRKLAPARFLSILVLPFVFVAQIGAQRGAHRQPAASSAEPPQVRNIFWQPNELKQGSPVLISVEVSGLTREVNGTWLGKRLRFFRADRPHVWEALAGADLDQKPGSYELRVSASVRGRLVRGSRQIDIAEAQFGEGEVNVAQDYVNPTPDEKRQIVRDEIEKKRAFAHLTPRPLWSGNFEKPTEAESTPSFGESRLMNEEKTSQHLGTDYPAREGTPVYASNSGIVVLASSLFYEGNCVIIDHGDRLFTVYMHMDKLRVRRGQRVRKHAELGISGRTGRVTGPHLHFEVVWNNSHLDPVHLLALTMPEHLGTAAR